MNNLLLIRTFAPSKKIETKQWFYKFLIMFVIAFFITVILFSVGLNAYYKLKDYTSSQRTVWEDADSVHVVPADEEEHAVQMDGFMTRIA